MVRELERVIGINEDSPKWGTEGLVQLPVTSVALSVELDPQAVLPSLTLVKLPGNKGGQHAFQTADSQESAPRRRKG